MSEYEENVAIAEYLDRILKALALEMHQVREREILNIFFKILIPAENVDLLDENPYPVDRARGKKRTWQDCIFALLSCAVQVYHQYHAGDRTLRSQVQYYLDQVSDILFSGIGRYEVLGDEATGYEMVLNRNRGTEFN